MKPAAGADAQVLEAGTPRRRAVRHYRSLAKGFHWITAALVLALVASGVIMKQLSDGAVADTLLALHKLVGALTLSLVLIRLSYRLVGLEPAGTVSYRRPTVHWVLYGIIILVPLLGWAGVSDFSSREIFFGYSLPQIWPEGSGYGDLMLTVHAYLAFGLLGLVVLHIGNALQDYMMRARD
ncbi:MAG TPA: cytochrome b/b6 domain-containing protein [Xanthobacteraceae bacterium]|nr:cytochrome b/b6 domain-containing protein [Xanthobacteraceae bacterium]